MANLQSIKHCINVLDALITPAAIIDREGTIHWTNKAWKSVKFIKFDLLGKNCSDGNFKEMLGKKAAGGDDYALKMLLGLDAVAFGNKPFEIRYPVQSGNSKVWFRFNASLIDKKGAEILITQDNVTTDMKAADALRESKEIYQQQFNHSMSGIILANSSGTIFDANAMACEILGYAKNELNKLKLHDLFVHGHPSYLKAIKKKNDEGHFDGELEMVAKVNRQLPVEVTIKEFRSGSGEMSGMVIFKDLTERKKMQDKLIAERDFNKAAISSIPGAFFVMNDVGKIVRWNDRMSEQLEYTEDELYFRNADSLIHKSDLRIMRGKLKEAFKTGSLNAQTRLVSKNGQVLHYHVFGKTFESEGETFLVGSGIDITEKKRIEEEMNLNVQLKTQLFENSPIGTVLVNQDGEVMKVNPAFSNIFGYSEKELAGMKLNDLIAGHANCKEADELDQKAFGGEVVQKDTVRYTKDGKPVQVQVYSVPVKINGGVSMIFGMYVDLRERHKLESTIKELLRLEMEARKSAEAAKNEISDALRDKEILLKEVHHRVKNNLAVMLALLELQMMDEKDPGLLRKITEIKSRILSIAQIHEAIYQNDKIEFVNIDRYVKKLIGSSSIYKSKYTLNLNPVELNLNQAVPFSLILNELLLAVEQNNKGEEVTISLDMEGDEVNLTLSSKQSLELGNVEEGESYGLMIVSVLLDQLGASMANVENGEKKCTIKFKKQNINGAGSNLV